MSDITDAQKKYGLDITGMYNHWNSLIYHSTIGEHEVCERWLVFDNFLEDMGKKPDWKGLMIVDRLGIFEKSNCKWASLKEAVPCFWGLWGRFEKGSE